MGYLIVRRHLFRKTHVYIYVEKYTQHYVCFVVVRQQLELTTYSSHPACFIMRGIANFDQALAKTNVRRCVAYLNVTMFEDTNSPVMQVPKMRGSLVCHEHVEAADYVSVTYYGIAIPKTYKILATKLTTNENYCFSVTNNVCVFHAVRLSSLANAPKHSGCQAGAASIMPQRLSCLAHCLHLQ